jgi:hypothetical protein
MAEASPASPVSASGAVRKDTMDAPADTEHRLDEQRRQILGELARGMVHDFTNCLTVIGGNLELVTLSAKDGQVVDERVLRAFEAVSDGQEMLKRLLDLAQPSRLRPRTVDVNDLIEGIADLLRRDIGEGMRLEFDLHPRLWPCQLDPLRFQAVLYVIVNQVHQDSLNGSRIVVRSDNVVRSGDDPALEMPAGHYAMVTVGASRDFQAARAAPSAAAPAMRDARGWSLKMADDLVRPLDVALYAGNATTGEGHASLYIPRDSGGAGRPFARTDARTA